LPELSPLNVEYKLKFRYLFSQRELDNVCLFIRSPDDIEVFDKGIDKLSLTPQLYLLIGRKDVMPAYRSKYIADISLLNDSKNPLVKGFFDKFKIEYFKNQGSLQNSEPEKKDQK
jgi:hypothetical protein